MPQLSLELTRRILSLRRKGTSYTAIARKVAAPRVLPRSSVVSCALRGAPRHERERRIVARLRLWIRKLVALKGSRRKVSAADIALHTKLPRRVVSKYIKRHLDVLPCRKRSRSKARNGENTDEQMVSLGRFQTFLCSQ